METDDDDTVRRMLGMKLVEAARRAGADLDPAPAPTPPRPTADDEANDGDFFGC